MKISEIKDYTELAEMLRLATKSAKCKIRVIDAEKNHFHFGMYNEHEQHIALVCYKNGVLSIAPFKSVNAIVTEDQLIPMRYFPVADQFCTAFMGLKDLVVNKTINDEGENQNA